VLEHLVGRFGGEAAAVVDLITGGADLRRPLVAGLPYLAAEAVWSARHELVHTLDDVLSRRTRALVMDRDATAAAAPDVAALIAPELGWGPDRVAEELAAFAAVVAAGQAAEDDHRMPAGGP
ncbi:MAG: glycerol-3-phosphate dehydrogenase C-terminal domain-containing protein, partial [Acidimicrobiales bacterium]